MLFQSAARLVVLLASVGSTMLALPAFAQSPAGPNRSATTSPAPQAAQTSSPGGVTAPTPQSLTQAVPVAVTPANAPSSLPPAPPGFRYVRIQAPRPAPEPELSPDDYEEGDPIPPGYRLREAPRQGLVTAGYVVTAIPYGIGAMAALSANFKNDSGYLLLPFVGPWLTIGRRSYFNCDNDRNADGSLTTDRNELGCVADVLVVLGLAIDGMMQAGGGAMLLTGYLATTKKLVRTRFSWTLRPQVIGTGYGVSALGEF